MEVRILRVWVPSIQEGIFRWSDDRETHINQEGDVIGYGLRDVLVHIADHAVKSSLLDSRTTTANYDVYRMHLTNTGPYGQTYASRGRDAHLLRRGRRSYVNLVTPLCYQITMMHMHS